MIPEAEPTQEFGPKLRVVHVTSVHPATDTRILYKECKSLLEAGYDVHLVAPGDRLDEEVINGIPVHRVAIGISRLDRILVGSFRAMKAAVALAPDIMHLHDPELIPHAWWAQLRGISVVFDMHEDLPRALTHKSWIPRRIRAITGGIALCYEYFALRQLPVVLAEDSYSQRRPWLKRFTIVRNMPVAAIFQGLPTGSLAPMRLAYIGHVSPERGCMTALEVLAELDRRGFAVEYDCVGKVPPALEREMGEFIEVNGLKNVRFHGYLPAHHGYQAIAGCSIGLALLHPVPNYIDSYPTKIFEYMAMGIPVIASDFPLYRKVLEDTGAGIPVDPRNIGKIADTIVRVLSDQTQWSEFAARGRGAVAKRYSWEAECANLTNFYKSLSKP